MTRTPEDIAREIAGKSQISRVDEPELADAIADEMVAEAMAKLKFTVETIGHSGAGRGGAGPVTR